MASIIYNSFLSDCYHANINVGSDTFYVMLMTNSYTPDKNHTKRSSLTSTEVTGTGYTLGGAATSVAISIDTVNNRVELTWSDVSWATSTITARYSGIYKHRGGASSADELVAANDFGSDISTTGGTFTVHFTSTLRAQN